MTEKEWDDVRILPAVCYILIILYISKFSNPLLFFIMPYTTKLKSFSSSHNLYTHTHTHTHTYIYIYIYIYVWKQCQNTSYFFLYKSCPSDCVKNSPAEAEITFVRWKNVFPSLCHSPSFTFYFSLSLSNSYTHAVKYTSSSVYTKTKCHSRSGSYITIVEECLITVWRKSVTCMITRHIHKLQ